MSVDALNLTVPIDPAGERFLLLEPASAGSDGGARQSLTFVLHWFEEPKERVPVSPLTATGPTSRLDRYLAYGPGVVRAVIEKRAGLVERDELPRRGLEGGGGPATVSRRDGVRHLAVVEEPHAHTGGDQGAHRVERMFPDRESPAADRPGGILDERRDLDRAGRARGWARRREVCPWIRHRHAARRSDRAKRRYVVN